VRLPRGAALLSSEPRRRGQECRAYSVVAGRGQAGYPRRREYSVRRQHRRLQSPSLVARSCAWSPLADCDRCKDIGIHVQRSHWRNCGVCALANGAATASPVAAMTLSSGSKTSARVSGSCGSTTRDGSNGSTSRSDPGNWLQCVELDRRGHPASALHIAVGQKRAPSRYPRQIVMQRWFRDALAGQAA